MDRQLRFQPPGAPEQRDQQYHKYRAGPAAPVAAAPLPTDRDPRFIIATAHATDVPHYNDLFLSAAGHSFGVTIYSPGMARLAGGALAQKPGACSQVCRQFLVHAFAQAARPSRYAQDSGADPGGVRFIYFRPERA